MRSDTGIWARRLASAVGTVLTVLLLGGAAMWVVSRGERSFGDTLFFALISISTVGYSEMGLDTYPGAHAVTGIMIITGVASIAFFQSTLTAMLVEGVIGKAFRRKRMESRIAGMHDHFVVCGGGRAGTFVVRELDKLGRPFVLVDKDESTVERLAALCRSRPVYVIGDATVDDVLRSAAVDRAAGVVCALPNDQDNLFVTLSARALNKKARIVAKVLEAANETKMLTAGATATVSPYRLGGLRLVSELVAPHVTEFLDGMLSVSENLRFDEILLPRDWTKDGCTLVDLDLKKHSGALVVAVRDLEGKIVYNPPSDSPLRGGMHLIVIVEAEHLPMLHEAVGVAML